MLRQNSIIYHYCSVESFFNIIKTNSLRLTHINHTNDKLEAKVLKKDLNSVIKEIKQEGVSKEESEMLDTIAKRLTFHNTEYIGCFSLEKDSLSQWTTYADDGKGVAIGFKVGNIPHYDLLNKKHGDLDEVLFLDEVYYSNNERDFLKKLLKASFVIAEKGYCKAFAMASDASAINCLSCFSKTIPFSPEREVRLVYDPYSINNFRNETHLNRDFMVKENKIVSFVEYTLPNDSLNRIVLGPKCKIDEYQLKMFLKQYGKSQTDKIKILKSMISYQ